MTLETFFEKFDHLFADAPRKAKIIDFTNGEIPGYANFDLRRAGNLALFSQQHLPRLSTMRTREVTFFWDERMKGVHS